MEIMATESGFVLSVSPRELSRIKSAFDILIDQDREYYKDEREMRDLMVACRRFKMPVAATR